MSYQVFDIETAPRFEWEDLPDNLADLWISKNPDAPMSSYKENASFDPVFSVVVCVSIFTQGHKKVESFCIPDEKKILELLSDRLHLNTGKTLVGHFIKKFDIPFLVARYAVNGLPIPPSLKMYGLKPWELNIVDTKEVWDSGNYRGLPSSSLHAVCVALGIYSPKGLINGSMVKDLYRSGDFETVAGYCEGDVMANTKVYLRMVKLAMI